MRIVQHSFLEKIITSDIKTMKMPKIIRWYDFKKIQVIWLVVPSMAFLPKVGAFSSFSGFSSCSWSGWSETGSETWWCRTVIDYGFKQSIGCKANVCSITNSHIQLCVRRRTLNFACNFACVGDTFQEVEILQLWPQFLTEQSLSKM